MWFTKTDCTVCPKPASLAFVVRRSGACENCGSPRYAPAYLQPGVPAVILATCECYAMPRIVRASGSAEQMTIVEWTT